MNQKISLKLAHVITTIERGGAEMAVLNLAKIQSALGVNVTIYPLKGKLELLKTFQDHGITVDASLIGKSIFGQIIYLTFKLGGAEVIHAHLPRAEIISFFCLRSKPLFITRHNAEQFFPNSPKVISRLISVLVTNRAKRIVAISDAVKSFLISHNEVKDKRKIEVIYYGYEATSREVVHRSAKNRLVIGTIARLVPQKNLDLFLRIIKNARDSGLDVRARIAGIGWQEQELRELCESLNLGAKVEFVGKVKEGVNFISSLDFFFLTSLYEGFGMVLLEAMDAQVPIIANFTSAIPEVLGEDHPGLVKGQSPEEFVARLISFANDPKLVRNCVRMQNERLQKFDLLNYFYSHHAMYQNVLLKQELL